ncbi:MAG: hypothetical protein V3R26_06520 [Hyphomicrobium sp.]
MNDMTDGTEPGRNPTFDLFSSRDMFAKLEREISRACGAIDRESIADHCTNAAWTAWHLAEWVWADIKRNYALKVALAKEAGVAPQSFDRDAFKHFVLSDGQCPELDYLQIIAVSSKHVRADAADDRTFWIEASAANEHVGPPATLDFLPIYDDDSRPRFTFKIVQGEERSRAIPSLLRARDYWAKFIDEHNVGPA